MKKDDGLYPLCSDNDQGAGNIKVDVWENTVYIALVTYNLNLHIIALIDIHYNKFLINERNFTNVRLLSKGVKDNVNFIKKWN